MKLFNVEIDGKNETVSLANPPWTLRKELMRFRTDNAKELLEISAKAEEALEKKSTSNISKEELERGFAKLESMENKMNEIVVSLCKSGNIKSIDDVGRVNASAILAMHKWIRDELGITEQESGFSRT